MTQSSWHALLLAAWAAVLIAVLRILAWLLVQALISALDRLPKVRQTRAWARAQPLRAWLYLRHPHFYAVLAARLRPAPFTGLPLTLFVLGAIYVTALLGALT